MNNTRDPEVVATRHILTFAVGDEWYALDVAQVRRVDAAPEVVPVPTAPNTVPGVFLSQGELIPAVDLRAVIGLSRPSEEPWAFAVIARWGDLVGGLLVDWVDEVVRVPVSDIETPTSTSGTLYASGQVRLRGRLVTLLQLDALLQAAAEGK